MCRERRYDDLLCEASDGLNVHDRSICFADASRPGQLSICACDDRTLESEMECVHTYTVSRIAHVPFVVANPTYSIIVNRTARKHGEFVALSTLEARGLLLFTNQAPFHQSSELNQTLPHLKSYSLSVFQNPTARTNDQNEAHPSPRRHDGALLQPRARRRQAFKIRQEPKQKRSGRVSVRSLLGEE